MEMERRPGRRWLWALTGILLVAFALRVAPLTDNRMHPDEALFASLGRLIITGRDPWLSSTPLLVDKPPLLYYTLAAGISLSWASELSARLPGLMASLISVALAARLAQRLWRSDEAAYLAGLIMALSPFAIAFSPTAFADPLMVMWILASLNALSAGRWGWGGALMGLGAATKQNALLFLPLGYGIGMIQGAGRTGAYPGLRVGFARFVSGVGLILLAALLWDAARGAETGFWAAGVATNDPGRLIRSDEVWLRAQTWLRLLSLIGGGPAGGILLGLGSIAAAACAGSGMARDRQSAVVLLIAAFGCAYLAAHWLVAVPVIDRYMLPVVPLAALLVASLARGAERIAARLRLSRLTFVCAILLIVLMGPVSLKAAQSMVPVGGDHGAYDGIDTVARFLESQPVGTVIYYDSLGWTLHYYLFDSYLYLAPFASPAALASDLLAFGGSGSARFLILPGWQSGVEVLDAVGRAEHEAKLVLTTTGRSGAVTFRVYRLEADPGVFASQAIPNRLNP